MVPVALSDRFSRAELTCSPCTHEGGAAKKLSRYLYLRSEELFDVIRDEPTLTDQDMAALVKDFYATIMARNDTVHLMSNVPDAWREERVAYYGQVAERAKIDLASNAFGSVQDIRTVMLRRRYGSHVSFDELSLRKAAQALLRAGVAPVTHLEKPPSSLAVDRRS